MEVHKSEFIRFLQTPILIQVIVSVGAGPWDQLFGGGNSPALVVAAISALTGGIIAILAIPRTRVEKPRLVHL